jgi:hypothetical protein
MRPQQALYRIAGKRFACGLLFTGTLCTGGAPMLRYLVGKQLSYVESYCQRKGWTMEVCE